jgi:hypothetical protein
MNIFASGWRHGRPNGEILRGLSNGSVWYLAKLSASSFTQDPRAFTIEELADLFAALSDMFRLAQEQVLLATAA